MIEALGSSGMKIFSPLARDDSKMEIADLLRREAPSLASRNWYFRVPRLRKPRRLKRSHFWVYFETVLSLASFQATHTQQINLSQTHLCFSFRLQPAHEISDEDNSIKLSPAGIRQKELMIEKVRVHSGLHLFAFASCPIADRPFFTPTLPPPTPIRIQLFLTIYRFIFKKSLHDCEPLVRPLSELLGVTSVSVTSSIEKADSNFQFKFMRTASKNVVEWNFPWNCLTRLIDENWVKRQRNTDSLRSFYWIILFECSREQRRSVARR